MTVPGRAQGVQASRNAFQKFVFFLTHYSDILKFCPAYDILSSERYSKETVSKDQMLSFHPF